MYAPQPTYAAQPYLAPQPTYTAAPTYAPQPAQSPALLAAVLTNPNLIDRILGTIGEHFAQKKNPRISMAPAPVGSAPFAASPTGYAAAPTYAALAQPGMMAMPTMAAAPAAAPGPPYGMAYGPVAAPYPSQMAYPPPQDYGAGPSPQHQPSPPAHKGLFHR